MVFGAILVLVLVNHVGGSKYWDLILIDIFSATAVIWPTGSKDFSKRTFNLELTLNMLVDLSSGIADCILRLI